MAEIGPVLSFLSQRIVAAPPELEAPRPTARSTPVKRFREGLLTETAFRAEMASLGWAALDIERSLVQARLERDFDDFQDRLNILEQAFNKDELTFEEMRFQVLELIPDQAKALLVVDLLDFKKRPKPKPLTPEQPPTLTVSRLLAGFRAGVLTREALGAELAERGFLLEDIDTMIAIEEAKLKPPAAPARKRLTLAELKALLALGLLSPEDFLEELLSRNYTPEDAANLLALEQAKALTRAPVALRSAAVGLVVEVPAESLV